MNYQDIETSDTLIKHIHFETMDKAEQELASLYGERYLDYRHKWELAGELKYEPEFPLYLMLEQTYRCNLRCVSCIHGYPRLRHKFAFRERQLSWELFKKVVLEGEENNCPSISMHNNDEPLLVKDLEKRVAFAYKHGFMDIILTTNGILFTEDKIKAVIDAGVTRILFSIDAFTEETYDKVRPGGNFQKVLWAMHRTREHRESRKSHLPILRASFVVNRLNQHELALFLKRFSSVVDYIDIQPFMAYYDQNTDLIPQDARIVTNYHCNGPWRTLIVRGSGDVLPCPNFYGNEIVVGNINEETLKEIFNSDLMRRLRADCKSGYYQYPACIKCSNSIYELDFG